MTNYYFLVRSFVCSFDRLKDSDVTWLYGPLHEHADPVPPPKVATTQDRLDLDEGSKKSILKHRTISEMLTTPGRSASPALELNDPVDVLADEEGTAKLFAVRSDSNLASKGWTAAKRAAGTPPATDNYLPQPTFDRTESSSSEEKRHISFNHRVEQCIAVDVDESYNKSDQDSDDDDEYDEASSEDDEVLTMKSSPRTSPSLPLTSSTSLSSRNSSPSSEHATIAKLAPTTLKTSEVYPAPSPAVVDPTGFSDSHGGPGVSPYPDSYGYGSGPDPRMDYGYSGSNGVGQWDIDEDFSGDFDYFNGPDMGDDYDSRKHFEGGPVVNMDGDAHVRSTDFGRGSGGQQTQNHASNVSTSTTTSPVLDEGSEQDFQASSPPQPAAPRSILKKRGAAQRPYPEETVEQQVGSDTDREAATDVSGSSPAENRAAPAQASRPAETSAVSFGSAGEAVAAGASSLDSAHSTSPTAARPTSPSGGTAERGRSAQRGLASSASYERMQDASAGRARSGSNGSGSSYSPNGSVCAGRPGDKSYASAAGAARSGRSGGNDGPSVAGTNTNARSTSDRSECFRGREGTRACGGSGSGGGGGGAGASSNSTQARLGLDSDSDGRGSFDFASPSFPASPVLGDRREEGGEGEVEGEGDGDAAMYGRERSYWSDDTPSSSANISRAGSTASVPVHSHPPSQRAPGTPTQPYPATTKTTSAIAQTQGGSELSVDTENVPSNDPSSPTNSQQVGPTPLNTPTLALGKIKSGSGSSGKPARGNAGYAGGLPESSPIPRRTSATGALVAPSSSDVRVPLASDYVDEDEGGIVGRAVEIVNTARDLIGALLGTGGDRGRSWREG